MIWQSMKMAWEAIRSNKMRSFLTMLGIIIGVTALVVLVSLINGATSSITSEVESLGTDMLTVSIMDNKGAPLRLEDLSEIAALDTIDQVTPSGSMSATAKHQANSASVTVYGVTPAYYDIQGMELQGNGACVFPHEAGAYQRPLLIQHKNDGQTNNTNLILITRQNPVSM